MALVDVVVGCSCNTSTTTRNRAAEASNGPLTDAEKRALVAGYLTESRENRGVAPLPHCKVAV